MEPTMLSAADHNDFSYGLFKIKFHQCVFILTKYDYFCGNDFTIGNLAMAIIIPKSRIEKYNLIIVKSAILHYWPILSIALFCNECFLIQYPAIPIVKMSSKKFRL
jgi:hypothetical protein